MRRVQNRYHSKDIEKSESLIGQLYPVLRDARGKVIDGFHRLDVDPNWRSVTLENVDTDEKRLIVSAHANLGRRNVSKKERERIVNQLAEIYYNQGLRADHRELITDKNGKSRRVIVNQIKQKIVESLKGALSKNQIIDYLLPKYKYQPVAEGNKRYYKKRMETMSAYDLLYSLFGKELKKRYGVGFFGRLEREMITKAKDELRNDEWFINKVKGEIRKDIENEIRDEVRLHND